MKAYLWLINVRESLNVNDVFVLFYLTIMKMATAFKDLKLKQLIQ
ncbi:hypothetical protein [Flavobacterium gyeonganense]|uniref:Uncharacterized protein n=1 Tax=Flavobacterium gyeonganense TaxID=1310418 RepID=A0ABV5HDW5_9FLAO|nr:hypothetical protein [Flavobacterium gyeonganense]